MNLLARESRLLVAALSYFTRLQVNQRIASEDLRSCVRYFPIVGILVGGVAAGVWWVAHRTFSTDISVILSVIATVLVTGAMHEDAFTDTCDGFGGAREKSRILAIMHDSRVGAFGVIGIVLLLGLKVLTLAHVPASMMVGTLVASHSVSRWAALTVMTTDDYVRLEPDAKARPLATRFVGGPLVFATVTGLVPMLVLPARFWWSGLAVIVVRILLGRWFRSRIGGYTGDCLGAVQQVTEVVFSLIIVALI